MISPLGRSLRVYAILLRLEEAMREDALAATKSFSKLKYEAPDILLTRCETPPNFGTPNDGRANRRERRANKRKFKNT